VRDKYLIAYAPAETPLWVHPLESDSSHCASYLRSGRLRDRSIWRHGEYARTGRRARALLPLLATGHLRDGNDDLSDMVFITGTP